MNQLLQSFRGQVFEASMQLFKKVLVRHSDKNYGTAIIDDNTPLPERTQFKKSRFFSFLNHRISNLVGRDGRFNAQLRLGRRIHPNGLVLH
jgi:hypothetical protein